jgi:hypothetical protein
VALSIWSCGPEAATPVPQPPAALPADAVALAERGSEVQAGGERAVANVPLTGAAGAAPPGAIVRVTNLEDTSRPVATTAGGDGSFVITVGVALADELRFEVLTADGRSQPTDLRFELDSLVPVTRFECLRVTPGLLVAADRTPQVTVSNNCEATASLSALRWRLPVEELSATSQFPAEVAPGETISIQLAAVRSAAGLENILFFDATVSGTTARYAITVVAAER